MTAETLYCLLPEIVLLAAATLIYMGGAFLGGRGAWSWLAVAAVVLSAFLLDAQYERFFWPQPGADEPALVASVPGPLAIDLFGQYVRWLVLLVGLVFALVGARPARGVPAPEYAGTLLVAIAGLMLVASARELVLLFVGLELISIPTYVLLYLGRQGAAAQEATAKYFFLSILSSAVTLYGFSFLYGAAGSTQLVDVRAALSNLDAGAGAGWFARLALVLIVAGLSFKITVVPFHFYAPDVYQGTSNGNAALLSVLPKVGGLVALVRIAAVSMPGLETYGWRIAVVLALLTMTLGNVVALWQDNVRRLLAYSAIAHGGYLMIGLAVGFAAAGGAETARGFDGVGAMLFYLAAYVLATSGTFAALVYLGRDDKQVDTVDELAGLGRTHPWTGVSIAVFMFSLTGIPPLAGFWGKLNLFAGAISVDAADVAPGGLRYWFLALAVIGVLNAAISAGYYLRIVATMYFRAPATPLRAQGGAGAGLAMLACTALVIVTGLFPDPLQVGANAASQSARLAGSAGAAVAADATAAPPASPAPRRRAEHLAASVPARSAPGPADAAPAASPARDDR